MKPSKPQPSPARRPQTVSDSARRLAGLDGLRGIAVALVVVFHFFPAVLPGGFVGVDVFFVISGFLITGLLVVAHERTGRVSLGRFWQRRARRLLPPLIPLVLACATAAWAIGGDVLVGIGWQVLGAATFGYNWVSIAASGSYFATDQPELFRNLWSLAVEEQFYLVWPFALLGLLLIRSPAVRLGLVGGLALASALWMGLLHQPGTDPTRVYYGSDTHSFGLFIGAALALALHRSGASPLAPRVRAVLGGARPWLGLAALAGLLGTAAWLPDTDAVTYRGGLLLVSLLSAVTIWAAVRGGRFGPLLDTPVLRFLGERSYGIYLWHWPVLVLTLAAWPAATRSPAGMPAAGLLAAALTLLAAVGSYRWLELPARRLGVRGGIRRLAALRTGPPRRRALLGLALVTGLVLVAGTMSALITAPSQTSAQTEIERGQQALAAATRAAARAEARASRSAAITAALAPVGSRITAVGDSVMLASAPELQAGFPGIAIDAAVSRGMRAAPELLADQARAGTLRRVVVVGLGTNGPIDRDDLADIRAVIGPGRTLILVNAYAERAWTEGVNAALADFSTRYRQVELADWHDAIAPHLDVLAEDNVHPGPTGGRIYTEAIRAALDRLGRVPPPRRTDAFLRPTPTGPDAPPLPPLLPEATAH
ncbi:acetyltransferase [Cryobacterium sp. TmT2-59]|nr:acetyltransferase [Cryobacterium sp. TmT2-59]